MDTIQKRKHLKKIVNSINEISSHPFSSKTYN
jgi:hypothetical protein